MMESRCLLKFLYLRIHLLLILNLNLNRFHLTVSLLMQALEPLVVRHDTAPFGTLVGGGTACDEPCMVTLVVAAMSVVVAAMAVVVVAAMAVVVVAV